MWDDVSSFFDPDLMGAVPDVRVPNASVGDWQMLLDLVAEKGWKHQHSEGDLVLPVPRAEAVLSRPADAEFPGLRVWPTADVLAVFRFHTADEVDFDVDLRELQGQDRLDAFCGFLKEIGRRLGKPVLMDPEGGSGHPVLSFYLEADRVVLLADGAGGDARDRARANEWEPRRPGQPRCGSCPEREADCLTSHTRTRVPTSSVLSRTSGYTDLSARTVTSTLGASAGTQGSWNQFHHTPAVIPRRP